MSPEKSEMEGSKKIKTMEIENAIFLPEIIILNLVIYIIVE